MLCSYGCGNVSEYSFKNGKVCCCRFPNQCPSVRKLNSKNNSGKNNGMYGKKHTDETKRKIGVKSKEKLFTDEYRENLSHSLKGNTNRLGIKHSVETKNKMSEVRKGKPLSEKNKKGISEALKGRKFSKEWRKKLSETRKKLFKNERFVKNYRKWISQKPTKIEFIINELVSNYNFEYVGDFSLWIDGKNPDFINKKAKKIIEVFGNYWHKKEDEYIRFNHFKKNGYEILVIWESEIYNNFDNVKKRFYKFLCK